jgi:hypothetical protein
MTVQTDIIAALGPLVGNRVHPNTFPQVEGGYQDWPAIRFVIVDSIDATDVCGSGTVATDDVRVQLDIVAKGYTAMQSLTNAAIAALMDRTPPATRQNLSEEYDSETKTHRATLDYIFSQSST